MNNIQKQSNGGFRIVWFMLLEATVSLIIITTALTIGAFAVVLLLLPALVLVIKFLSSATAADIPYVDVHSLAPYTLIIDGWKTLARPVYMAISNSARYISRMRPRIHMTATKQQRRTVDTLVSV